MTRAASVLGYLVAGVVLALVLGVCMGAWSLSRPGASGSATPDVGFATPSAVPTPSPSPIPPGVDGLRIFPMGTIPTEHRFFLLGDPGDERILLLDLAKGTVQQAAHFESFGTLGKGRQAALAALGDGSTLAILLTNDRSGRLLVLHPSTGALTTVDAPTAEDPRLSPDARSVAVARITGDDPGVYLVSTADGSSSRLVPATKGTVRPVGWSRDGQLAIVLDANGSDPHIGIARPGSTSVEPVGPGRNARWRGSDLLFWSEKPGTGVNVYDTTTGIAHPAFAIDPETVIQSADTRPGSNDIVTEQFGGTHGSEIYVHSGDAATLVLRDAATTIAFWYSRDGRHLYVWTDDHNTSTVRDLSSGAIVLQFCLRGGVTPPCAAR